MAVIAVAGCDVQRGPTTPANAYLRIRDRVAASLGIEWMFPPCEYQNAVLGGRLRIERCYRMTAPQRWSGVWANEFEGSRFCPGARDSCPYRRGNNIWLDWSGPAPAEIKRDGAARPAYRLTFIGRRTLIPGAYGHMGMSKHYLLVDRVIRAEPLPKAGAQ